MSIDAIMAARLERVADVALEAASGVLETLPRDRNGQRALSVVLNSAFEGRLDGLDLTPAYVSRLISDRDPKLAASWKGTTNEVVWLMLHEALSNSFPTFAVDRWDVEIRLLHHVPKSSGTSVYRALYESGGFATFPQLAFEEMVKTRGLLGFATQLANYRAHGASTGRVYVAGHFSLPQRVQELGLTSSTRGVTLARDPATTLSSALRYVWRLISEGAPDGMAYAKDLDPERISDAQRLAHERTMDGRPHVIAMVHETLRAPTFREQFAEVLRKHYCGAGVETPADVRDFLREHDAIIPVTNVRRDAQRLRDELDLRVPVPTENASVVTHDDLVAMVGEPELDSSFAPLIGRDDEIFSVLEARRAQATEAAAANS